MATAAKKVRRPAVTQPVAEETQPGDIIDLKLTELVKKGGTERWVGVGLSSQHRPGETSEEAVERISDFVINSLDAFREQTS